jgi:hypothetical protein
VLNRLAAEQAYAGDVSGVIIEIGNQTGIKNVSAAAIRPKSRTSTEKGGKGKELKPKKLKSNEFGVYFQYTLFLLNGLYVLFFMGILEDNDPF